MAERILILGGTLEASQLAARLVADGHDVTTSLAGRTTDPVPIVGQTRIGGFGGAEGLVRFLVEKKFDRLIDATHPFALQISANARAAAATAGVKFESRIRAPWRKRPGDNWQIFSSLADACAAIPAGARVFLAIGSQYVGQIAGREDVHFVVRMVDPPGETLALASHEIVLGRPAAAADNEVALFRDKRITHILCRNSGGSGAYAKIEAARQLNIPVLIIEAPTR